MKKPTIILLSAFCLCTIVSCNQQKGAIAANVQHDDFIDLRDGQVYRTAAIGGRLWMAENLNFKAERSWCYDGVDGNCTRYGRLYDHSAAKDACPEGWNLPQWYDWEALVDAASGEWLAGKKLKSRIGWSDALGKSGGGTDELGFSALGGGGRDAYGFHSAGNYGYWWTGTELRYGQAYAQVIFHGGDNVIDSIISGGNALSVRCLRFLPPAPAPVRKPATGKSALTDSRDGQVYRTVKIGKNTWMAENLNYKTDSSSCYGNDEPYCKAYGRLYTWNAATEICPQGWHLPDWDEWGSLSDAAGGQEIAGERLKSKSGWARYWDHSDSVRMRIRGTDRFGFSALGGGRRDEEGRFQHAGVVGYWWYALEYDSLHAGRMGMVHDENNVSTILSENKYRRLSVRCVKDRDGGNDAKGRKDGSVTDSRDGQKYRTVKIGRNTWMAENLNYKTDSSYCYGGNASNCGETGRLYDWEAATKACPAGWHLPGREEWTNLMVAVSGVGGVEGCNKEPSDYWYFLAGKKLKSKTGWPDIASTLYGGSGTDDYGFSALPGGGGGGHAKGWRTGDGEEPHRYGYSGVWWSIAECARTHAYSMSVSYKHDRAYEYCSNKSNAFSVRCVKE